MTALVSVWCFYSFVFTVYFYLFICSFVHSFIHSFLSNKRPTGLYRRAVD